MLIGVTPGGKRVRPIVMTTIAMGAGMLPVAMGWGADPSFRVPMAVTIIGGLISSTLLSLFIIPVIFTYIDDFAVKCGLYKVAAQTESDLMATKA
jgi:multidrug efflux pump subunit AcrB